MVAKSRVLASTSHAITIDNLSKVFKVYDQPFHVLLEKVARREYHKAFWALRDISCTIRRGTITGIVGRNGAGKSTLLKIVSGTLQATSGTVKVDGKVAAILELGTGFHPEFTGRENIYIGGMCLGMTREEISARIDEIIAFSELDEFIDWPFKTYSSGMKSRLTFATATSIDPEILIIDEALSVGDARFQRKSFSRIEDYRKRNKTILLVSHDANTISEFCDEAILLERGEIKEIGDPKTVLYAYHKLLFGAGNSGAGPATAASESSGDHSSRSADAAENHGFVESKLRHLGENGAPVLKHYTSANYDPVQRLAKLEIGDGRARIVDVGVLDKNLRPTNVLESGGSYRLWFRILSNEPLPVIVAGFVIRSTKGVDLYGWDTDWARLGGLRDVQPNQIHDVWLQIRNHLANGHYFLTVAIADAATQKYDLRYDLIQFSSIGSEHVFTTSVVNLEGRFGWHQNNVFPSDRRGNFRTSEGFD
jgi:lipopolysaccharide transport system ATP-binding protein